MSIESVELFEEIRDDGVTDNHIAIAILVLAEMSHQTDISAEDLGHHFACGLRAVLKDTQISVGATISQG